MRIVTLITDFGWQDLYVGQLKGRLLQACPALLPLDLTHSIPAWDRDAAARALHESWPFFPAGTIHLVVVDPGVGSARQLVAASGQGHFFLGPDNGRQRKQSARPFMAATFSRLPPGVWLQARNWQNLVRFWT